MGRYEIASGNSVWRGRDYYNDKRVISCEKQEKGCYDGKVRGSENEPYEVHIDLAHPKRSTCNCPFAKGRRVVCKHMMAMYFTVFPDEIDRPEREYEKYLEEEEEREHQEFLEMQERIKKYTKKELQEQLLIAWQEIEDLRSRRW